MELGFVRFAIDGEVALAGILAELVRGGSGCAVGDEVVPDI